MVVTVPHASVAVAVPSAAVISEAVGLQASVNCIATGCTNGCGLSVSSPCYTVLEAVAELLQPSIAVNVLTCVKTKPLVEIVPSVNVTIGVLQASVAVARTSAAGISSLKITC